MLSREEILGGVLGGLAGGFLTGIALGFVAEDALRAQGALYGVETMGWIAYVLHGTALGVLYAVIMGAATDWYLTRILSVTRRSETAANVLKPLINRFGITTVVTGATGLQFGIVVWVLGPVVLVPLLAGDAGGSVPQLDAVVFLAYVGYGLILGVLYGKSIEH